MKLKIKECPYGNRESCCLVEHCVTQKHEYDSCVDMVSKYNAGLLLPPEYIKKSSMQGEKMLSITFECKDKYSHDKWNKQSCVVSSLKEYIEIYGLGKDCEYHILSVKEAGNNA